MDAPFERVGRLVDAAPSLADLESHRLELLAARRWRAAGRALPAELAVEERLAAAAALAAPAMLERVRAAARGPLLLVKGPEVARHYPSAALRGLRDLDLVVADAQATQRELLAAGFVEVGEPAIYEGIHHLRPLAWPGLPIVVEVHRALKWVEGLEPPPVGELLRVAVPATVGVSGVLALPPAHHAVVLAAHAWAHRPLGRLRDLLDVALVTEAATPAEVERVAAAWGLARVWRSTRQAIDAVLGDGPRPASLALWARHLEAARERTVFEAHLQRWLAGLWALPPGRAVAAGLGELRSDLWPEAGEGWRVKLSRSRVAVGNAFTRKSQHDELLGAGVGLREAAQDPREEAHDRAQAA